MRTRTITGHDDWLRQSRARMGFKRQRSVRDRDLDAGDRDLDAGDTMLHAARQVTRRLEGGADAEQSRTGCRQSRVGEL